jgi:hypothetical protein
MWVVVGYLIMDAVRNDVQVVLTWGISPGVWISTQECYQSGDIGRWVRAC